MFSKFSKFLGRIVTHRKLIVSMAKREVATQYIGSLLGIIWAFLNPLVMILVFWFVFSIGFRVRPMQEVPFVVWLTAGMAPWFYFAETINGSTSVVVANTNLVKKMLFPSEVLPVVKLVSSLVSHLFFMLILFVLMAFQGIEFSAYFFQGLYYLVCLLTMVLGFSWMAAAVNVFIRDVSPLVAMAVQIGFWATPIFWDIKMMPERIQLLLKLNPVYYIVQGYRESFIYFTPFWHHPYQSVYFWIITLIMFTGGAFVFMRLKPQFADVL